MSDDKTRPDLTRLEDISAFFHQEDDEVNAKLETYKDPNQSHEEDDQEDVLPSIDDLEDDSDKPAFHMSDDSEMSDEDEEQDDAFPQMPKQDEDDEATIPDFQLSEADENENLNSDEDTLNFGNDENFPSEEFGEEFSMDSTEDFEESEFPSFNSEDAEEDNDNNDEEENFLNSNEDMIDYSEQSANDDDEDNNEVIDEDLEANSEYMPDDEDDNPPSFYEPEEAQAQPTQMPSAPTRETFQDVRRFSENITYGNVALGGNPPFSIVLKKIKYHEDGEAITAILEEHGLINESNRQVMTMSIEHGTLLLSQLSEYAAIYLCHKLRRFNLEILMGLSEEIRPSKSYENEEKGLVTKSNLRQNKTSHHEFKENEIKQEDIILSLDSRLDGMQIVRYIDIISSHKVVLESELRQNSEEEEDYQENIVDLSQSEVFDQLKERLRARAFELKANAVVGITYQLTPLNEGMDREFKVTCTGNAVWLIDAPGARN